MATPQSAPTQTTQPPPGTTQQPQPSSAKPSAKKTPSSHASAPQKKAAPPDPPANTGNLKKAPPKPAPPVVAPTVPPAVNAAAALAASAAKPTPPVVPTTVPPAVNAAAKVAASTAAAAAVAAGQPNLTYDTHKAPQEDQKVVEEILATEVGGAPKLPAFARLGGTVPPLSSASKIPFLTEAPHNRLESAFIHCLPADVPPELKDIESPNWKDGKFLIKTFLVVNRKTGRRSKSKLQFPACLLFSAKTLYDRLTVVNFWLSQKKEIQLNILRNRQEGLLKYYMQLKDTRENTFRQAYISGNPAKELQKKREKQLLQAQLPPPKDVEEVRKITVDEHCTCLDYMLKPSLHCVPCDRFRNRFLPPHHRMDCDKWPLYKERRKEIVQDTQDVNTLNKFTCDQLFDVTKEVGRGVGHKKKRVLEFLREKRIVTKTPSLLEWQHKRTAKPCFGLAGEGVRALIMQSAEQANRRALLKDEIIPDSFGLPDCYHNRSQFNTVIVRKEERMIKTYSRGRSGRSKKDVAAKSAIRSGGEGDVQEKDSATNGEGGDATAAATTNDIHMEPSFQQLLNPSRTAADTEETTEAGAEGEKDDTATNEQTPSKYHYVIRSKECAGEVDTEKAHKLCKACTEAAVMVRSIARDAAKPLNLSKGAVLTKLDLAKLVCDPDLIESTIRSLRQLRAKDMKLMRKEVQRLRDRAGIPKQVRRKPNSTNAAVAEQLQHVEHQLQANPLYEVGNHHEVHYDSDEPAEPHDYGHLVGRNLAHTRMLPRGAGTTMSPSKRARTHY